MPLSYLKDLEIRIKKDELLSEFTLSKEELNLKSKVLESKIYKNHYNHSCELIKEECSKKNSQSQMLDEILYFKGTEFEKIIKKCPCTFNKSLASLISSIGKSILSIRNTDDKEDSGKKKRTLDFHYVNKRINSDDYNYIQFYLEKSDNSDVLKLSAKVYLQNIWLESNVVYEVDKINMIMEYLCDNFKIQKHELFINIHNFSNNKKNDSNKSVVLVKH